VIIFCPFLPSSLKCVDRNPEAGLDARPPGVAYLAFPVFHNYKNVHGPNDKGIMTRLSFMEC